MFIVGKVLKPQGLKGEIKAEIITSFPEHFEHISDIYIEQNEFKKFTVEETRFSKNFVFLRFKEIQSRNDAESLRGEYLYIQDKDLVPLKSDEFYHHQLLGLNVYDEDDSFIGVVKDIETYPENDILVVTDENKNAHLIPVIKDIIKRVDLESQKVTIHVMEGLLG